MRWENWFFENLLLLIFILFFSSFSSFVSLSGSAVLKCVKNYFFSSTCFFESNGSLPSSFLPVNFSPLHYNLTQLTIFKRMQDTCRYFRALEIIIFSVWKSNSCFHRMAISEDSLMSILVRELVSSQISDSILKYLWKLFIRFYSSSNISHNNFEFTTWNFHMLLINKIFVSEFICVKIYTNWWHINMFTLSLVDAMNNF